MRLPKTLAVAFLFCLASAVQAQNLLINDSFEDPLINDSWRTYYSGQTFGGWTVDQNSVDLINRYWVSADGSQSVDLSGDDYNGAIYQDVPTVVGQRYQLDFQFSGNPVYPEYAPIKSMSVFWGPDAASLTEEGTFLFDVRGYSQENMGWVARQIPDLIATSSTMRLRFVSNTIPGIGPVIDAVSLRALNAVPEPNDRATLTLGMTLGVFSLRHARRRKV